MFLFKLGQLLFQLPYPPLCLPIVMFPSLLLSLHHPFQLFNRLPHLLLCVYIPLRLLLHLLYLDLHLMHLLVQLAAPSPTLIQLIL